MLDGIEPYSRDAHMFEKMKSGDLVVFSGIDPVSSLITRATDSPYTHVGIVLVLDDDTSTNSRVCILESNVEADTPDVLSMQTHGGVIIRDLRCLVEKCKGAVGTDKKKLVWWAPRTQPLTQEQEAKLKVFALRLQGRPYDYVQAICSPLALLDDLLSRGRDGSDKLFCSELVVLTELSVTGMVYHNNHKVPINASAVVPKEVLELHVSGVPIWGEMVAL